MHDFLGIGHQWRDVSERLQLVEHFYSYIAVSNSLLLRDNLLER